MDQPNLTVLTGAFVNKLMIEGTAVTGVEFEWRGQVRAIKVSSEVILSAGAIQTPKILMLSGIGDRAELTRFGIACVSNLPGVGRNFQDHPVIGASLWEPHEFLPARANAAEANAFVKSHPDLVPYKRYVSVLKWLTLSLFAYFGLFWDRHGRAYSLGGNGARPFHTHADYRTNS